MSSKGDQAKIRNLLTLAEPSTGKVLWYNISTNDSDRKIIVG